MSSDLRTGHYRNQYEYASCALCPSPFLLRVQTDVYSSTRWSINGPAFILIVRFDNEPPELCGVVSIYNVHNLLVPNPTASDKPTDTREPFTTSGFLLRLRADIMTDHQSIIPVTFATAPCGRRRRRRHENEKGCCGNHSITSHAPALWNDSRQCSQCSHLHSQTNNKLVMHRLNGSLIPFTHQRKSHSHCALWGLLLWVLVNWRAEHRSEEVLAALVQSHKIVEICQVLMSAWL